jgi:N6-adenosine-specific RNA methylase IME4
MAEKRHKPTTSPAPDTASPQSADLVHPVTGEVLEPDALTVDEWAAIITARWQDSVEAILDVGRMLLRAKSKTPSGSWLELIAKLPFGESTAEKLISVGLNPLLQNSEHVPILPPSWGTLYALTKLSDEQFRGGLIAGIIRPDMQRKDVLALRNAAENAEIAASDVVVPAGRYHAIVIDPPWQMQKIDREVRPNQVGFDYPTMSEDELAAFPLPDMAAPDCHLFLWTTHKFLPMALRLAERWGFAYVCTFVWHKPGGFQPIGLPQYNCEFALYCRRGSPRFVDTKQFFTCFEASRREHSRKPDAFYDVIRRVCAGPRIDVFSREARDGFDQFGNQVEKFGGAAA